MTWIMELTLQVKRIELRFRRGHQIFSYIFIQFHLSEKMDWRESHSHSTAAARARAHLWGKQKLRRLRWKSANVASITHLFASDGGGNTLPTAKSQRPNTPNKWISKQTIAACIDWLENGKKVKKKFNPRIPLHDWRLETFVERCHTDASTDDKNVWMALPRLMQVRRHGPASRRSRTARCVCVCVSVCECVAPRVLLLFVIVFLRKIHCICCVPVWNGMRSLASFKI